MTAAHPVSDPTSAAASPRTYLRQLPWNRTLQAALGLIALQLVFRGWVVFGAWYHGDDFAFISRMSFEGLGLDVAAREHGGHLMPAGMYLTWLCNVFSPYEWWVAATVLMVLQAAAALGFLRLLIEMFGVRPGILAPLAIYLFTVFGVPVTIWWAAAVNQLPLQIAVFFGTTSFVRHLRDRRHRDLLIAMVWVGIGLLFFEKTVLILGLYAVLALSWFARGSVLDRARETWSTYRGAVIAAAAIGAAYLFAYAHLALNFRPGSLNQTPVAPVVGNMVLRSWLTAIFGGPLQWEYAPDGGALARPSDLLVLAAGLALWRFMVELRRTRASGTRAIALPAFFLLADVVLVTAGRSSLVGAAIAREYRYIGELGGVTALALACAVMPILGAPEQVRRIRPSALFDDRSMATVACALVCLLSLYSSVRYASHWHQADLPKRYFQTALGQLDRSPAPVDLVDGAVPNEIMWGIGFPSNMHSHLLADIPRAHFVHVATDHLSMIGTDGRLRPAVVPPTRSAEQVPRTHCDFRISDRPVTIPLDGPLAYGGWWVRLGYLSSGPSPVTVSAGGRTYRTTVEGGLHSLYFAAGDKPFDSVRISALQGSTAVCTDDVTVGRPEPGGAQ